MVNGSFNGTDIVVGAELVWIPLVVFTGLQNLRWLSCSANRKVWGGGRPMLWSLVMPGRTIKTQRRVYSALLQMYVSTVFIIRLNFIFGMAYFTIPYVESLRTVGFIYYSDQNSKVVKANSNLMNTDSNHGLSGCSTKL